MLTIPFLAAELLFAAIWLLARTIIWVKQKSIDWKREAILLLMFINLAVIIRYVFFPRELLDGHIQPIVFDAAEAFPFRINLRPFERLFDYYYRRDFIWNVFGNAALFVPTGIILPVLYRSLDSFWKVVLAGAFISLCVEILQLPLASRSSDVDDLILNTLGVIAGYLIYTIIKLLKSILLSAVKNI